MNRYRTITTITIWLIVSLFVFVACVVLNVLNIFNDNVFGHASVLVYVIVLIISVLAGFWSVFFLVALVQEKRFLEQLKLENTYVLGHPSTFYNLAAFKQRVSRLMKKARYHKLHQCIIAFSTASMRNYNVGTKNDELTELNYLVSKTIEDRFDHGKREKGKKYNVFCFNRGIFLIYTFAKEGEDPIGEIVNSLTKFVFDTVKEKEYKIWAQPFFGVRDIDNDNDNLTSAIEDALIARNNGEDNFESFTRFIKKRDSSSEGTISVNEIQDALKNNEFIPYYQAKFSVKDKKVCGCEVLARWKSPKYGLLSPAMFIDKAEQYGLISAIDIYIFEKALIDLKDNLRRGRRVVPVSCNFSLYEFFSRSFLDSITSLLQKYQVPPSLVEVEVTESTSQVNQFLSVSVIKKLKEYGVRVLMDDYGVGYSQIQNLRNIPFDAIKIDKSFTDKILSDEKTSSIVKFLIELGHTNDMEVIIEGVEKKEQVDMLRKMHVDTIQGFYYSKPLPFNEFNEFLKNNEFEVGGKK